MVSQRVGHDWVPFTSGWQNFTLLFFILMLTYCPNFTIYNALLEIKKCKCYTNRIVCSKNIEMLKKNWMIWNHEGITLNNLIVQEIYHSVQMEWGHREARFCLLEKTIGAPEVLKKEAGGPDKKFNMAMAPWPCLRLWTLTASQALSPPWNFLALISS